MSLSQRSKDILEVALADKKAAKEVADRADRASATVAAIATADATDLASAEALANANKAKINEVIAALKASGLMK